eukprot:6772086-Prymnesium_polylepis.1
MVCVCVHSTARGWLKLAWLRVLSRSEPFVGDVVRSTSSGRASRRGRSGSVACGQHGARRLRAAFGTERRSRASRVRCAWAQLSMDAARGSAALRSESGGRRKLRRFLSHSLSPPRRMGGAGGRRGGSLIGAAPSVALSGARHARPPCPTPSAWAARWAAGCAAGRAESGLRGGAPRSGRSARRSRQRRRAGR